MYDMIELPHAFVKHQMASADRDVSDEKYLSYAGEGVRRFCALSIIYIVARL